MHLAGPRWIGVLTVTDQADFEYFPTGISLSPLSISHPVFPPLSLSHTHTHTDTNAIITHFGGAQDGMDPNSPSYGTLEGACGFGPLDDKSAWPYFSTAAFALNNKFSQDLPSFACGACFQIQCIDSRQGVCKTDSKGVNLSIKVVITDVCPECGSDGGPDHVDVQSLAFAKIADPGIGRISIRYRRVECAVPEDLKVSVMDFSGQGGWIRLTVDDTGGRGAIQGIWVSSSNDAGNWIKMENRWGAAYELNNSPAPPLNFKFELDGGEIVEAYDVVELNGGISGGVSNPVKFNTNTQFEITDPAAQEVRAFSEGPADPMLITSSTPGNTDIAADGSGGDGSSVGDVSSGSGSSSTDNTSSTSTSSTSNSDCSEEAPVPGDFTCQQQAEWGKCTESWMAQYCECSCKDQRRRRRRSQLRRMLKI